MAEVLESAHAQAVRRQLIDLVRNQGPGLLDDGRRARAMLADAVAGATAEANLIALAIASGVPGKLRDAGQEPGRVAAAMDAVAQDLHRTSSVQPADARWAVMSIAEALGLTTIAAPPPHQQAASGPGPDDLVLHVAGRQHVAVPGAVVTLGRDPDCTMALESPAVSRLHARVVRGANGWEFRDEGSTQGSFVNGVAVTTFAVRGDTEVTLGQGREAVSLRLVPFGEARTRSPQRPRPAQATELPGQRPGGALAAGGAPATQLGGASPLPGVTVALGGATRKLAPGDKLSIGREDDNGLVAPHTTVSRHHARVEHDGNAWLLRDLGSTSGTWLDGQRIEGPVALRGRQHFVLGDARDGDRLVTEGPGVVSGPATAGRPQRRRPSGRVTLVAAAAAVVAIAGGLAAWQLLGDEEVLTTPRAEAASVSRDDIARATVQILNLEGGVGGSGVIIDRDKGLILTNAHVAATSAPGLAVSHGEFADEQAPNPKRVRIDVSDGLDESAEPRFWAELVAADGYLDIAVLQIRTKLSGAPAEADDLADLVDAPLGDSDDLATSDQVSFYGYPGASDSAAPTFTTGVVSGPVQDERLDEFRAVINTTADISAGNSGGPAVDDSGQVVGVATWARLDDRGETAFSRIRPINLAMPVIEAARAGEKYRSPYVERGPRSARIPFFDYGAPGTEGVVAAGCTKTGPGGDPTTLTFDYKGFPKGPHTDVLAELFVNVSDSWMPVASSSSVYPTKLPSRGCMTVTFDDDVPPGTYRLKVGVGGDLRVVVDQDDFTIQ